MATSATERRRQAQRGFYSIRTDTYLVWLKNTQKARFAHFLVSKGMESEILKSLIDFFYTGEIRITNDNVIGLLTASSQLLLPNLVQACGQFLADFCLDEENCLRIFAIATSQNFAGNLGWLEAEAMRFIQLHFESIWQRHSV